jgi:hypothetical protein
MKWRCSLSPPPVVILPGHIDDTLFPFVLILLERIDGIYFRSY